MLTINIAFTLTPTHYHFSKNLSQMSRNYFYERWLNQNKDFECAAQTNLLLSSAGFLWCLLPVLLLQCSYCDDCYLTCPVTVTYPAVAVFLLRWLLLVLSCDCYLSCCCRVPTAMTVACPAAAPAAFSLRCVAKWKCVDINADINKIYFFRI